MTIFSLGNHFTGFEHHGEKTSGSDLLAITQNSGTTHDLHHDSSKRAFSITKNTQTYVWVFLVKLKT
jgi:hypothetical protein